MDYIFRKALDGDWNGIYDVEIKAFGGGYSKYFLRMVPNIFGKTSYVVESEGEIIGYSIGVIPNGNEQEGWIMSLGIIPTYQGKGLGSQLLNVTIDSLKENGVKKILLTVAPDNLLAKSSYEKQGFKEVGFKEDYYGEGEHRIMMELMC